MENENPASNSKVAREFYERTRPKGIGEDWSPEKRGRALLFIWTLANAHHTEWKSKAQIWAELQEFKS